MNQPNGYLFSTNKTMNMATYMKEPIERVEPRGKLRFSIEIGQNIPNIIRNSIVFKKFGNIPIILNIHIFQQDSN